MKLVDADEILDFKGYWPTHFKINSVSVEKSGKNATRKQNIRCT